MLNKFEQSLRRYRIVIVGGFTFILLTVVTIAALLITSYQRTLEDFEETVNRHNRKVEYATLAEMAAHIRGEMQQLMVLIDDPFVRDEVFLQFNKAGHEVNVAREQLRHIATSEEEVKLIAQQDDIMALMVEKHRLINDLLMEDSREKAAEVIVEAYQHGRLHVLFTTLQAMREMQKSMSEEHLANARQSLAKTTQITIAAVVLVMFSSLLLIWIFLRYAGREGALQEQIVKRLNESKQRHEYLALHDSLTSLPNRAQFFRYAGKAFIRAKSSNLPAYILFLDIDGFKTVNDRLGHEAGNELLQQISLRIQQPLSVADFVARLGGDEFVVVSERDKDEISALAATLVKMICEPYNLNAGEARIGTSIGIADVARAEGIDEALHHADIAMYQSKGEGGCRYTFCCDVSTDVLNGRSTSTHLRVGMDG